MQIDTYDLLLLNSTRESNLTVKGAQWVSQASGFTFLHILCLCLNQIIVLSSNSVSFHLCIVQCIIFDKEHSSFYLLYFSFTLFAPHHSMYRPQMTSITLTQQAFFKIQGVFIPIGIRVGWDIVNEFQVLINIQICIYSSPWP